MNSAWGRPRSFVPLDDTGQGAAPPTDEPETARPDAVTVEAMTSDNTVTPGQPSHYRFQGTNTGDLPALVQPVAVNSLSGWTGQVIVAERETGHDGALTIGPWQSTMIIVEVRETADARVGDRNTIALRLDPVDDPASERERADPEPAMAHDPGDAARIEDEPA